MIAIIIGVLLLGIGTFLIQWNTKDLDEEKYAKNIFIGFLFGIISTFIFVLGCLYIRDESFSSKDYYLDYKIVTTQIGDGAIVRDTTYILTRK